ncbi:MAG: oligoendopeptidase F, partial [Synergistaceae bacterium]|nr:oligoendopeptidase F [Synergistaceae bacterium]
GMERKSNEVPERSSIPDSAKWNLEAIYESFEAWQKSFDETKSKIEDLAKYSGRLGEGSATLLAFIKDDEAISLELNKLYVYANMKSHEDLREQKPMELAGLAENLTVKYSAAVAFFEPELLALPHDYINGCIKTEHELARYEFFFRKLLREREHILSNEIETLLAKVGEMRSVPENAFTLLTDADIKFPDIIDEDGNTAELTEERWYRYSRSKNRDVRKNAFVGIYGTYEKYKNAIGALYYGSVKGDAFYASARKYKNSLDMALFAENVPESVYDHVVGTAKANAGLMHRLVTLRKKVLGLDEFHYYDLNVPISKEPETEIKFDEAVELALKALAPLGDDYLENFKRGVSQHWIDIYENKGKRKGAYSWGAYGTHPYVLLNYDGTLHDVFTLVHEMGHSLHSFYSRENQPQVYADYTILLAEVASTTNEALLLEYLLRNAKDEENRKWLLSYYYDMTRTTFFRQAMFADFERESHSFVESGNVLTPDWLSSLWEKLNRDCYGPEMKIDSELCVEWARIPHFYSAFYVYKYSTGFTAANAFASSILAHEDGAVDRYLNFLKSGGSDYSLNILRRAGVDLTSSEPFERTMKFFDERLNEGFKAWGI